MLNNGQLSNFFELERDCCQGDPLSPYLFIIGVELLDMKLKLTSGIKGVHVADCKPTESHYADDTFLLLDG